MNCNSCLASDNIAAARMLLSQSKNKSSILNEKDDCDCNVLMYALQRQTDECLKFIIEELAIDHARSLVSTQDDNKSRESSYSRKSLSRRGSVPSRGNRRNDEDDLKKVGLSDEYDDVNAQIHPMYFMTTVSRNNIFHILLMSPEGAQSQLSLLESVLSEDQIQKMLSTPNEDDKLPLHVISGSIDAEVLQWVLDGMLTLLLISSSNPSYTSRSFLR